MALLNLHEFHFVISQGMKEGLEMIKVFKETLSVSGTIAKSLESLVPVIEREHKWGDQRMSRYMSVSDDPSEKRYHAHTYLPEDLYRKLKLIHQDLNVFSIAQMVRELLGIFLGLVQEYGDTVLSELKNIYQQWEKEAAATRLTLRQYLRQLWKVIQHLPGENRKLTLYDSHFSPFWKLRL